eukprot:CAMPEP_0201479254 /NCGR_PEP_ID=MMETSP0151_2-20130828/3952_1 /ASSEMBLY_ACC=CAM_ASM_000257 /TAXON_ID=200890 /ORGANISM="Paramoeba atlantica, Strain 621/1 / CCAP 1560/9" /LENGTH=296 /DNA_ID=CAMNT_0047860647 /DNA_START=62 /DNA_END=948 /DNA_ORIENTATION=+
MAEQDDHSSSSDKTASEGGGGRTLWVGEVETWMDESFIQQMFLSVGYCVQAKLIRDKASGMPSGYGFAEFPSHEVAKTVLDTLTGKPIPVLPGKKFRLNWATFGNKPSSSSSSSSTPSSSSSSSSSSGSTETTDDPSIFVGDLDYTVDDEVLARAFSAYTTIREVKVILDPATGQSKGYGFVRFYNPAERDVALTEMQGFVLNGRCLKLNLATPKKVPSTTTTTMSSASSESDDPTSTTLMVTGLDDSVTYDVILKKFSEFGNVLNLKVPQGKGVAYIQFGSRSTAESALKSLNGT